MKIAKIVSTVLLLELLVIGGYAVSHPICIKDGICFEIIVKNPIDPDVADDQW